MDNYLIVALAMLVAFYGGRILDRLPKADRDKDFTFELPDDYVAFRVDNIMEDDFTVSYVDGWQVGRSFAIYGRVLKGDDTDNKLDLDFGERTGVKIGPSPDWFQSSRIGYVRVFPKGGCEMGMGLPYQIARQALEDLRRDPDQVVRIGIKQGLGKNGKTTYGIYSFELSTPFDRL